MRQKKPLAFASGFFVGHYARSGWSRDTALALLAGHYGFGRSYATVRIFVNGVQVYEQRDKYLDVCDASAEPFGPLVQNDDGCWVWEGQLEPSRPASF